MSAREWREVKEELERMKESGNEAFRGGDILRAMEIYEKIIDALLKRQKEHFGEVGEKSERDKLFISVNLNIAACAQKQGEHAACIRICGQILNLDKTNVKALYRRGQAYESLKDYESALKDFEKLTILDPKSQLFKKSATRCRDVNNKNPEIIERSQVPNCSSHVGLRYNDKMVMWGGEQEGSIVDKHLLHIYWPLTNLWFRYQTKDAPSTLQIGYASVIFQNKLAIFGGAYDQDTVSDDLFILDLDTLVWSKMRPSGRKRYGVTGWHYKEKLWLFGGMETSPRIAADPINATPKRYFSDVFCYNLSSNTWSIPRCRGRIPEARYHHSTTDLGDFRILLFGGVGNNGFLNDVHIFHMETLTWTSIETINLKTPRERGGHVATVLSNGDRLLVHGGSIRNVDQNQMSRFSTADDSWVLDIKSRQWSTVGTTPASLSGHSAVNIDGDVFFYGGANSADGGRSFHYPGKMFRYKGQGGTPDRLQNLCLKAISKWSPEQKEMLMSKNLPKSKAFIIAKLICHPKNRKIDSDIANLQSPLALLNL